MMTGREDLNTINGLKDMKTLKSLLISSFLVVFSLSLAGQKSTDKSAAGIIETIIRQTRTASIPNTVDVIKAGDPGTEVKGIVTTMFATMEVLKKAKELGCNLIIAHEPLYYNHLDDTKQLQNDPVYLEKKKFIDDNKLVVWRFHDYIHSLKPDAIDYGMTLKLGWTDYVSENRYNRFDIPRTSLKELLVYLKRIFPENAFHIIGNPDMKLSGIAFAAGAPGSSAHIRILRDPTVDVLLAGEVPQWETYEYARDAVSQNRNKAVIFLGHVTSEESGMEYCAEWLREFIKDIPVHFVASGPSYWTY
jgi:putative NIF3 family GTP cyclohydrolase 1 type 2